MQTAADNFFVVTGGPGSGKTALVDALRAAGYETSNEAGRRIIQEQVAIGGNVLPWADRAAFADAMLAAEIASYRQHAATAGAIIFDRGIPDVIGYLRLCGLPVPIRATLAAERLPYNPMVFICPPWRDIFTQDSERKQDFAEAERTYSCMRDVYTELGYELVELPKFSVAERAELVARHIDAAGITARSTRSAATS